ncbi:MAG: Mu transposase C-terminal domain-containing protein [Candidatus Cloacimonetes bacterium]|jgi:putative transposase|nr:transposase family protein [Candidatus Cloacimonadota bacterium]MDD2718709.1 Mu transposase C-terminal domain-containing protein [Candidatus Cloacimonadota bacterium]
MKATFEAHRQGDLWQDHCDKVSTVTGVTVVREEHEMPKMQNGRDLERCDNLSPGKSVTVHGIHDPEVKLCEELLISHDEQPGTTAADKDNSVTEFPDLSNDANLPLRRLEEAKLLGHFCSVVLNRLRDCESRTEEWKQIVLDYNNGLLVPELYQMRDKRCERTIRTWIEQYLQSDYNMFALVHSNWNTTRKRKVTEIESQILLSMLLHPNRVKIGSAIKLLKAQARLGYFDSGSSIPTLRRWCTDFRDNNPDIWQQARLGSKFVAEHIIKTIHRDSSLLRVGDVWVADGHKLAFDILDPKTGKAKRMMLILVLDWASRYPVGAALAFTEDSQHILSAFRNGFLNTVQWHDCECTPNVSEENNQPFAFLPRYVYLDNGRAFKSKLFHDKWESHDLAKELGGIFPKLKIEAVFAESYNAKAKVIERFFQTFQEQFERFVSSFRGASVEDKPATLMRNEKWAKKLFKAEPPTIEEAMSMIGFYIRQIYGEMPHSGSAGKTPWEVFRAAQIPPDRIIEPSELNFLMLSAERKAIRNEGIIWGKLHYWHPDLINHIGKPIIFRYDPADIRWILVYDTKDKFICQAELRRAQHPFIKLAADQPIARKELDKEYRQIKKLQRQTEQSTRVLVKNTQEAVDKLLSPLIKTITQAANPTFIQTPMLTAPQAVIDESEQSDGTKSFAEMLRLAGIR